MSIQNIASQFQSAKTASQSGQYGETKTNSRHAFVNLVQEFRAQGLKGQSASWKETASQTAPEFPFQRDRTDSPTGSRQYNGADIVREECCGDLFELNRLERGSLAYNHIQEDVIFQGSIGKFAHMVSHETDPSDPINAFLEQVMDAMPPDAEVTVSLADVEDGYLLHLDDGAQGFVYDSRDPFGYGIGDRAIDVTEFPEIPPEILNQIMFARGFIQNEPEAGDPQVSRPSDETLSSFHDFMARMNKLFEGAGPKPTDVQYDLESGSMVVGVGEESLGFDFSRGDIIRSSKA